MKIAVITPLFAIAGVPLAQVRFARALAQRGHDVDLVVGHIMEGYEFTPPSEVNCLILGRINVRSMLLPLVSYFKATPLDVVFSAEDHLNVIVTLAKILSGSTAKNSASSRVTPFDTYSNQFFTKRWALKRINSLLMRKADVLTCVSIDMVKQYQSVFKNAPHVCVYNIVSDGASVVRMQEPVDHPWLQPNDVPLIVAAGRLAPWKGFADLIDAMALACALRQIRLLILGDGPLRDELQQRIAAHGLVNAVQLLGYVENPLKYFARADVFALSSHVEGLPNVLVEAMMCGCTPVATDCPTGPREVLDNGRYGYLVKPRDPRSIADGILRALDCRIPQEQLAVAVRPFEEGAVIARHFDLLGLSEYMHRVPT
jgi:glycosyltransferase involved in cell wall biosynthesis